MTIVADASALVEHVLRSERAEAISGAVENEGADLHIPALCDVEVASALRGALLGGKLTDERAGEALDDYLDLPLARHGHESLLPRILELRESFTAYDAVYVALAERLDAALLTADDGLAASARRQSQIEVLPAS
ncbi:MAG: type II toxin-antitoxin system VapC family toxin [Actinomycetota bacterium]